jgi:hypothetical protein
MAAYRAGFAMHSHPVGKNLANHLCGPLPVWACASIIAALNVLAWAGIGSAIAHFG